MKTDIRSYLFMFLLLVNCVFLFKQHGYGQDLLALKSGEKVNVKITSISKKHISFYKWDDQEKVVHKLSRKFIQWYRPESLTKKRFSFSFSFGCVPYGTSSSLKKFMKDHGYSSSHQGWFGGVVKYPQSKVKIPWMLEFEYNFKPPHGFSIAYSAANNGSVQGYSVPEVVYKNPQLMIYYKHYSRSFKSNFQAGFLINFCTISIEGYKYLSRVNNSIENSKNSLGLMVGYAGSIVEKDKFFLRFQSQFKYVPSIEFIGRNGFLVNERIGLCSLFIGIQTGFKIYPDKN